MGGTLGGGGGRGGSGRGVGVRTTLLTARLGSTPPLARRSVTTSSTTDSSSSWNSGAVAVPSRPSLTRLVCSLLRRPSATAITSMASRRSAPSSRPASVSHFFRPIYFGNSGYAIQSRATCASTRSNSDRGAAWTAAPTLPTCFSFWRLKAPRMSLGVCLSAVAVESTSSNQSRASCVEAASADASAGEVSATTNMSPPHLHMARTSLEPAVTSTTEYRSLWTLLLSP